MHIRNMARSLAKNLSHPFQTERDRTMTGAMILQDGWSVEWVTVIIWGGDGNIP
jgi:hypothetical protein